MMYLLAAVLVPLFLGAVYGFTWLYDNSSWRMRSVLCNGLGVAVAGVLAWAAVVNF